MTSRGPVDLLLSIICLLLMCLKYAQSLCKSDINDRQLRNSPSDIVITTLL